MWLLDYRLSTAVWVGIIALVGLAAQTGIVMIVYIDNAFHQRKAALATLKGAEGQYLADGVVVASFVPMRTHSWERRSRTPSWRQSTC